MLHRRTLLRSALLASATALAAPALRAQGAPRNPNWPRGMTMVTAGVGGTFAVYGPAWGTLVQRASGIPVSYRTTQGSNQNIILVERKEAELAMLNLGAVWQGREGKAAWTNGQRYLSARALFPMFGSPFLGIALQRSGIRAYPDLAGKVVGGGPRGGQSGTYAQAFLDGLGVRAARVTYASAADTIGQMQDGLVHAFLFAGGQPIPNFTELEAMAPVNYIGFTEAEIARLRPNHPELAPTTIAAGTYRSQQGPITTLGVFSFGAVHRDFPEDLAYLITRTVLESNAEMVRSYAGAKESVLANWNQNTVMPFHPGAVRYYREKGITIPANMIGD
ncbi:MAG: TAXI family TRAP transporter solute-binding subunit [Alphaproteobacteria bacterium]|nr:TAXI family TRAP transporter solute-binding subunit [Alphaproteobacteria bacterium]